MMSSRKARVVEVAVHHPRYRISTASVQKSIACLEGLSTFRCPLGNLSIVFVDDREIKRLHREFMDDASVTDVITFVGEDHPLEPFAGEICINLDQAKRAAREHKLTLEREVTLYLVHGWLHLSGLRDHTVAQSKKMRQAEAEALAHLDGHRQKVKVLD
jgi:probable rRNA maturation factor